MGWIGGIIIQPAASITLLEYMIIYCNIQVIIYPLKCDNIVFGGQEFKSFVMAVMMKLFRNQKWPFDGKLHAVKYNLCTYYNKVPAIRYIKDKVFNLEGYKELIFSMDAVDKIASGKLMYIPNDCAQHYPLVDYNQLFKR